MKTQFLTNQLAECEMILRFAEKAQRRGELAVAAASAASVASAVADYRKLFPNATEEQGKQMDALASKANAIAKTLNA